MIFGRQLGNETSITDTNALGTGGGGQLGVDAFPDIMIESLWIATFTM
jgi:hypothetical protein